MMIACTDVGYGTGMTYRVYPVDDTTKTPN